jgi:Flp pilus assembly protein TadG
MKHSIFSALRSLRDFWRHQKSGSTLVMAASVMSGVVAVAGLSIDVGRAYAAKRALSGQTQAAALAGAYALGQANSTSSTVSTAVSNWTTANPVSGVTISGTPTPTLSCNGSTSGLPTCSGSNPNVVSFTQTGTVPTYFLKAVGVSSMTVSATASAAKAGGTVKPFNIMFVLDATGSMSSTDSGCTVPGISSPSRWQCALYSIQSILKVMPTAQDGTALMIFPGLSSQYSPGSGCSSSNEPSSAHYYATTVKYQIGTTFDNTYNDGAGNLSASSPMVRAVGIYKTSSSTSPCLTNKGGQGSYAAEVINKAQETLAATTNNATNVIIFLSDGDYGASQTNLSGQSSKVANQCAQAVTAAQAATAAGTQVFSVAYGASTATSGSSSSCTTDTPTRISACTTMQTIASDSSKFYSTDSTCSSTNNITQLPSVFQAISTSLTSQTKPRLLTQ